MVTSFIGRTVFALGIMALTSSCAHHPSGAQAERDARRLLVLERGFSDFIAVRLDVDVDGRAVQGENAVSLVDANMARLESLRMQYLDLVGRDIAPSVRVAALVRMAELHLDLGARIRRIPYEPDANRADKLAFDTRLSRLALPLEATGHGVLAQAVDVAARDGVETRLAHRAALYLALHGDDGPLSPRVSKQLQDELEGGRAFPAPRRLLEGGRIGQRAARIQR